MSKECCRLDHLDGIPDRPHLIFSLELKSKNFVLRFFPQLKPFGVLGHTPEPNTSVPSAHTPVGPASLGSVPSVHYPLPHGPPSHTPLLQQGRWQACILLFLMVHRPPSLQHRWCLIHRLRHHPAVD